jgi:predicted  nucleic acid-binding Zn-ribbon protein
MEERPVETLVNRIDAALARIERAISRDRNDLNALQDRHDRLRHSVGETLREIDALIAQARE